MRKGLRGQRVLVAGAGLAGLTAGLELHKAGADVLVLEARDRIGGRVWTIPEGFRDGQHAEAGGDLIEEAHEEIRDLGHRLGLQLVPVLRKGFGFIHQKPPGLPLKPVGSITPLWTQLTALLRPWVETYELNEGRWDSPVIQALARTPVADWVAEANVKADIRAMIQGLRGFFLADPADLSLLALVEQVALGNPGQPKRFYRIKGGNSRLPNALAIRLGRRVKMNTMLRAVHQTARKVRVTITAATGGTGQFTADYLIIAVPATTLARITFTPPLPPLQRQAITMLRYGSRGQVSASVSETVLAYPEPSSSLWDELADRSLWEGNEEQAGRPAGNPDVPRRRLRRQAYLEDIEYPWHVRPAVLPETTRSPRPACSSLACHLMDG
jgi:monoamine oxidase